MSSPVSASSAPSLTIWRRVFLRSIFLLWVALLAFGLPEVIAGTGRLWLSNPASYILVIPLYALHFLLLAHVAIRTGRTSWPSLYMFGVLFGLYETWITKVVWRGYPETDGFSFGGFGQWFGVHETLGLILFYHAVISFLLPLAVVSRLFPVFGRHFPVPDWVFGATRAAFLRRLGLLFVLGIVTGQNNPVLSDYVQTWVPMLVLLWLGYVLLRKSGVCDSEGVVAQTIARPHLSRWGFVIALLWLGLIYVLSYLYLNPAGIAPVAVQLVTVVIYLVLLLLMVRVPAVADRVVSRAPPARPARQPFLWLLAIFAVGLLGNLLSASGIGGREALAIVAFLAMVPIGLGLFLWLVGWKVVLAR